MWPVSLRPSWSGDTGLTQPPRCPPPPPPPPPSGLESKASVVGALRSIPRDEGPPRRSGPSDKTSTPGSLRRPRVPVDRADPWRRRQHQQHPQQQRRSDRSSRRSTASERASPDGSLLGDCCSEPLLPPSSGPRGGDPIPVKDALLGKRARVCPLTDDLEAHLRRLNFAEEEPAAPMQPASSIASLSQDQGEVLGYGQAQPQPLWIPRASVRQQQEEVQCLDLNSLLERDFSVQSMASVVNEDCFYDSVLGIQKAAIASLWAGEMMDVDLDVNQTSFWLNVRCWPWQHQLTKGIRIRIRHRTTVEKTKRHGLKLVYLLVVVIWLEERLSYIFEILTVKPTWHIRSSAPPRREESSASMQSCSSGTASSTT